MYKLKKLLKVWFGRDTLSVVGSRLKKRDDYIVMYLKGL